MGKQGTYYGPEDITIVVWLCQDTNRFQLFHKVVPKVNIYFLWSEPMDHKNRRRCLQANQQMWCFVELITAFGETLFERCSINTIGVDADNVALKKGAFPERDSFRMYLRGRGWDIIQDLLPNSTNFFMPAYNMFSVP